MNSFLNGTIRRALSFLKEAPLLVPVFFSTPPPPPFHFIRYERLGNSKEVRNPPPPPLSKPIFLPGKFPCTFTCVFFPSAAYKTVTPFPFFAIILPSSLLVKNDFFFPSLEEVQQLHTFFLLVNHY